MILQCKNNKDKDHKYHLKVILKIQFILILIKLNKKIIIYRWQIKELIIVLMQIKTHLQKIHNYSAKKY